MSKEKEAGQLYSEVLKLGMSNGRTLEHAILKQKVLDILQQPIQNADLSWEECDQRFIEKIKAL